jgi:hypothetical protein
MFGIGFGAKSDGGFNGLGGTPFEGLLKLLNFGVSKGHVVKLIKN